jgi:hypothetical protein
MNQHNETDFHWGFAAHVPTDLTYLIVFQILRMNAGIFDGSDEFKALQLSNMTGWKIPPFAQAEISQRGTHVTLRFDQEPVLLGSRILKEHAMMLQLPNALIRAPTVTSWWHAYDLGEIN